MRHLALMAVPGLAAPLLGALLAGAPEVAAQDAEAWRSALYPADWKPGFSSQDGRFLHDFSYAGYRYGEVPLPAVSGPVFDVVAGFGADPRGGNDASAALQAAIDAAGNAGGGVVFLPAGLYRCDRPVRITASGVVLQGTGAESTRVFFTSVPERGWNDHLEIRGAMRLGDHLPMAADAPNQADMVAVEDSGSLREGDHVAIGWVITPEFVEEHQMTGTWKSFNGKWRPFFQRQVVRVDRSRQPHRVFLDVPLRYAVKRRDTPSLRVASGLVQECGIAAIGIANAVAPAAAWSRPGVHAVAVRDAVDCWVRDVASFPSPLPEAEGYHLQNGGILVVNAKRVTIAHCRMEKAQNRGGGGSGYLFHISRANDILTRDCVAVAGRHNFIQNWDFGSAGLVWLRCTSRDGRGYNARLDPVGYEGLCEYHHSLAMAGLVDSCVLDDGWFGGNRHDWSSGAGATVTESVYWNCSGKGRIRSWQTGHGHIIGTTGLRVETDMQNRAAAGTAPEDSREGIGQGATLAPQSLYEDQLRRRLQRR